jgi:spermidine synthase
MQQISDSTNSDIFSINLLIGFFILSLGIGSYLYDKYLKKYNNIQLLSIIELSLGIITLLSFLIISYMTLLNNLIVHPIISEQLIRIPFEIFQGNESLGLDNEILKFFLKPFNKTIIINTTIIATSIIIGIFSGIELPLIIKIAKDKKINQNLILGINYFGAILSSFILIFYLKSHFSQFQIIYMFSLTYLIISIIFCFTLKEKLSLKISGIIFIIIILSFNYLQSTISRNNILTNKSFYFPQNTNDSISKKIQSIEKNQDVLEYNTKYQKIHKVFYNDTIGLFLNNKYQLRLDNEYYYHESMIHIPLILFNKNPENVLLLGAGDGFLLRELTKLNIKNITHIELDNEFLEFCKKDPDFSKAANFSLNNETKLIYNDAFYLTQKIKQKYDFIIIDFPHPHSYDLSKLYSLEFIRNIKKLLNKNGLIVMDVPIKNEVNLLQEQSLGFGVRNNNIIYSTFSAANYKTSFFFSIASDGFVVLSNDPIEKNFNNKNFNLNNNTKILFENLKNERIPFIFDKNLVNSIFKPIEFQFKE